MTHEQAVVKHAGERYLLDDMPELERFAFEEHLFACSICAEDIRVGAVMQDGVHAGLLPEEKAEGTKNKAEGTRQEADSPSRQAPRREPPAPRPEPLPTSPRPHAPSPASQDLKTSGPQDLRWRMALPWAVAAMLALATGYQALFVVPGLRQQIIGPSVLSPVTLRGATRGSEPSLTRPTSGAIALAVDLAGVAPVALLTYDLRAADGVSVASGTAAAPPPGTPLLLLIPASALDSAGRYTLSVGTSGAPGSASAEYRFSINDP